MNGINEAGKQFGGNVRQTYGNSENGNERQQAAELPDEAHEILAVARIDPAIIETELAVSMDNFDGLAANCGPPGI
ncbi:hypothetical protein [Paenibacillus hemerocallicola]|uniref:hypothetical protein n=1 Tax=Paenibacillus hemerocallicola TaxID=1172614 RepID=UPI001C401C04|nr:hypothetical protein [Paenibacillus hemerocallicola]